MKFEYKMRNKNAGWLESSFQAGKGTKNDRIIFRGLINWEYLWNLAALAWNLWYHFSAMM